ncbi:Anti-anti-sigma regulatory factor (antagonist of anti-sigma factor) [Blastococcus aggregatus]|uniref:Anti-anti-sigma regulatory factor (Antagonist of anti-sigma factor) n=2 Tax=Blastococcus aggregatus TaxID=38502 RepID=A0A285V7H8_9ACTN|nr:Anti-anti-sigma regulatory factor (antagonist of anti-sigma factor) [Blastococcus aggregatus]
METKHEAVMNDPRPLPLRDSATVFSQVINTHGCVRARGDLTRRTADQLRGTVEALRHGGFSHVVVDLRELRSTDEFGLSSLKATRTAVEAAGDRLTVLAPRDAAGTFDGFTPPGQ